MSRDWVLARLQPGWRVLDAGAGSGYLSREMEARGCKVFSVDFNPARASIRPLDLVANLSVPWSWAMSASFDAVVATYAFQHFTNEAMAWAETSRVLVPNGPLLLTGRYSRPAPYYEMTRNDPCRGYNRDGIEALAMAAFLRIDDYQMVKYDDQGYTQVDPPSANAFAVCARKDPRWT